MRMLRITQCRDPLMWYAGLVGELVPYCGKWPEAYKSLEPAGVRDRGEERKKDEQAETAKRKAEAAYREALFGEIRSEVRVMVNCTVRPGLNRADDLALVTRQFWARTGFDAQCRLAKLHIQPGEKMDNHERVRALNEAIDGFSAGPLVQFLFDLSLVNTLDLPTYSSTIDTPAPLLEAAKSFDLSPDDIRKSMTTEQTGKAGKKSTAKPTPTPTDAAQAGEGSGAKKQKNTPPATQAARAADRAEEKDEEQAAVAARGGREAPYRHPKNPDLCWSGRGRKPQWVVEWLLGFGTLEQLKAPERCEKTLDLLASAS